MNETFASQFDRFIESMERSTGKFNEADKRKFLKFLNTHKKNIAESLIDELSEVNGGLDINKEMHKYLYYLHENYDYFLTLYARQLQKKVWKKIIRDYFLYKLYCETTLGITIDTEYFNNLLECNLYPDKIALSPMKRYCLTIDLLNKSKINPCHKSKLNSIFSIKYSQATGVNGNDGLDRSKFVFVTDSPEKYIIETKDKLTILFGNNENEVNKRIRSVNHTNKEVFINNICLLLTFVTKVDNEEIELIKKEIAENIYAFKFADSNIDALNLETERNLAEELTEENKHKIFSIIFDNSFYNEYFGLDSIIIRYFFSRYLNCVTWMIFSSVNTADIIKHDSPQLSLIFNKLRCLDINKELYEARKKFANLVWYSYMIVTLINIIFDHNDGVCNIINAPPSINAFLDKFFDDIIDNIESLDKIANETLILNTDVINYSNKLKQSMFNYLVIYPIDDLTDELTDLSEEKDQILRRKNLVKKLVESIRNGGPKAYDAGKIKNQLSGHLEPNAKDGKPVQSNIKNFALSSSRMESLCKYYVDIKSTCEKNMKGPKDGR